jgi:hypothetical protein
MADLSDTVATPDGSILRIKWSRLSSLHSCTRLQLDAELGVLVGAVVTLASLYTATAKSGIKASSCWSPAVTSAFGYASQSWATLRIPVRLAEYVSLGKQRM